MTISKKIKIILFKLKLDNSQFLNTNSFLKKSSIIFLHKILKKLKTIIYLFIARLKNNISFLLFKLLASSSKKYKPLYSSSIIKTKGVHLFYKECFLVSKKQETVTFIKNEKNWLFLYKCSFLLILLFLLLIILLSTRRSNIVSFPTKRSRKTVLRSPHIDKRSREQFEKLTYHSYALVPFFFETVFAISKHRIPLHGVEAVLKTTIKR